MYCSAKHYPHRNQRASAGESVVTVVKLRAYMVTYSRNRNVFAKKQSSAKATEESTASKEEQAIELLKGMTPEQIMAVISAINK